MLHVRQDLQKRTFLRLNLIDESNSVRSPFVDQERMFFLDLDDSDPLSPSPSINGSDFDSRIPLAFRLFVSFCCLRLRTTLAFAGYFTTQPSEHEEAVEYRSTWILARYATQTGTTDARAADRAICRGG